MKPKKTKMCADCAKEKIVFNTADEAQRFIDYNGAELYDDPSKLRVYHCDACAGFHITSKPYKNIYKTRTDDMIEKYHNEVPQDPYLPMKEIADMAEEIIDIMPKGVIENKRKTHQWLDENCSGINGSVIDMVNVEAYYKRKKKHHL